MITRIRIGRNVVELDNHKSTTREHQVEELKNFITRPALFKAQHNA